MWLTLTHIRATSMNGPDKRYPLLWLADVTTTRARCWYDPTYHNPKLCHLIFQEPLFLHIGTSTMWIRLFSSRSEGASNPAVNCASHNQAHFLARHYDYPKCQITPQKMGLREAYAQGLERDSLLPSCQLIDDTLIVAEASAQCIFQFTPSKL